MIFKVIEENEPNATLSIILNSEANDFQLEGYASIKEKPIISNIFEETQDEDFFEINQEYDLYKQIYKKVFYI